MPWYSALRSLEWWSSLGAALWEKRASTGWVIAAVLFYVLIHEYKRRKAAEGEGWCSIEDGINYISNEYKDTYQTIGPPELVTRRILQDLHELMCRRWKKIRVRGALHTSATRTHRISPKLCRKLRLSAAESSIGTVYHLAEPKNGVLETVYISLSLKKSDLFRHFTKRSQP